MSVPEDPRSERSVSVPPGTPLVPVSAEDFASRKRRIVSAWMGAALLVAVLAAWAYRHSVDPVNAQRSVEEGRRLFKATRYTEAILSFDHALALKSDLPDAYLLRGRANAALSRLDPAVQDFTKVIQLRPGDPEAFVERAEARLWQENYQGVIADCREALARDPRIALAYSLRGIAVRQAGAPRQALEDFSRAVELAPDESSYFQRAATYQMLGEHTLALADLDQVIALKPDGSQGYFARAQSRRATGDLAGADRDRRQAMLLDGR
jgi:tetratricopeptide (TPR) repeat protein